MPPHTHRPPPRAITRVCNTSIALVKKSINHISFRFVELLLKVCCGQFVHLERLIRLNNSRFAFHVPFHVKDIFRVDGGKCIFMLRGVRPFLSDKYDLTRHPNYRYTADADPKNVFDMERYMKKQRAVVKPTDTFDVYEIDATT